MRRYYAWRPWSAVLLAVMVVCALSIAGITPAAENRPENWAQPVELEDSENFFRVSQDVYRAAQPGKKGMKAYEAFGIRTVINLRARHSDTDEAEGTKLALVHIPTRTRDVSSDEVVVKALQAIRDAEKPALVHCMHGADRTGLVIAMYRIVEQGWSRDAALDEMRNGGFGFHSIWTHIPDYLETLDEAAVARIRGALC